MAAQNGKVGKVQKDAFMGVRCLKDTSEESKRNRIDTYASAIRAKGYVVTENKMNGRLYMDVTKPNGGYLCVLSLDTEEHILRLEAYANRIEALGEEFGK